MVLRLHIRTYRGTITEQLQHSGDHLFECSDPEALANLGANPRES